jgi:hypothetical protein
MRLGVEAGGEVGVGRRAFADMDVKMGRGTRLLLLAASTRLGEEEVVGDGGAAGEGLG